MNYLEIRPRGIQPAVDLWNFFARQTEQEQKVDQVHDCDHKCRKFTEQRKVYRTFCSCI